MKSFDERDNDAEIEADLRRQREGRRAGASADSAPARPPSAFWSNPIVRIAIYCLIFWAINGILSRVFEIVILNRLRPVPASLQNALSYAYTRPVFALPVAAAALAALWLVKRRDGRSVWRSTGFVRDGAASAVFLGLVIGVGVEIAIWAMSGLGKAPWHPATPTYRHYILSVFGFGIAAVILRAIDQETMFRGFMLQELERRWGTLVGVVFAGILYALFNSWYLIQLCIGPGLYDRPVKSLVFSILTDLAAAALFTGAFLMRRNLWLPISLAVARTACAYMLALVGGRFPNYVGEILVQAVVGAWLIYLAMRAGQWRPGPGPKEMAQAAYAGVVKIVDLTDPGKEVDAAPPAPTSPAE